MIFVRHISILLFLLIRSGFAQSPVFVPAGGNVWVTGTEARVTKEGVTPWTEETVATFYVRTAAGDLTVALSMPGKPKAQASVTIQGLTRSMDVDPVAEEHRVGTWTIPSTGYVAMEVKIAGFQGGLLRGLRLSGSAVADPPDFVKNNEGNFFYWGRRGPSVHLRYELSGRTDLEYFYSEITVPEGNDVIGSYFMANGFSHGYFGFQVNSETERRILFSVWSPYQTDDPKLIPEADRIILKKKGEAVYTGEFGNEGSGGQSYLRFPWKAGTTYGFLLQAQPEGDGTIYTAWFFAPEINRWNLVASWHRPRGATRLTSLYSFLENFIPDTGNRERHALYGNAWVRDMAGQWTELTQVKFTGDNTARKRYRMDYGGGVRGNTFYLRQCGFFSDFTPLDQVFTRPAVAQPPAIDFSSLP